MTRAAKITYACFLLLGLFAGGYFGFRDWAGFLPGYEETAEWSASETLVDFGRAQFRYARPDAAAGSLQLCVTLIEKIQRQDPKVSVQDGLAETYIRLAILADRNGDNDASRAYLTKARQQRGEALLHQPASDSELKDRVNIIDRLDQSAAR